MKPIFIPLKKQYFEEFERREKTTEYRKWGPRWNGETCRVGRRVTLSLGYTLKRLHGRIVGYYMTHKVHQIPGWRECYGDSKGPAVCITVKLDTK